MKVKKYRAGTMPEAMKQIRTDLGGDAIILNTREVEKGGFLGFFSKKYLEVVAAVDPDALSEPAEEVSRPVEKLSEEKLAADIRRLENDIQHLKNAAYPGPLDNVHDWLKEHEVDKSLAEGLMQPLVKQWYTSDESLTEKEIYESLKNLLKRQLEENAVPSAVYDKKYLLFAGPTGVGKTTTLAKIAARARLEDHKRIAFITADTYRIAAVDQLKAYADILNVPIDVAYTKEDFLKAKKTFSDYDLVLVDTAGRNFRESSFIEELKTLIPFDEDMQTWLVLSMTAKYKDMRAIYRKFTGLAPKRCVLTKIDETVTYGALVNFWMKDGMVPAYLTNGQNVPDDLLPATPECVAGMLTGINP
ncbi:MAG TPA: flagellar biosynthesis protein FlhF [Bacillales bacterium]|nr:flagellar biosynthesis protein FlhF [Bacillales bacterium]